MFIYTVRARTLKLMLIVAVTLSMIVGIGALGGGEVLLVSAAAGEIDYSGIKTNEDRVEFIARDFNLGKYLPEFNETVYFE